MDDLVTYRNIRIKNKKVILWASPYGVYCYPYCTISFSDIIKHSKFGIYCEIEKMERWSISFKGNKSHISNRLYFIMDKDVEIIS